MEDILRAFIKALKRFSYWLDEDNCSVKLTINFKYKILIKIPNDSINDLNIDLNIYYYHPINGIGELQNYHYYHRFMFLLKNLFIHLFKKKLLIKAL